MRLLDADGGRLVDLPEEIPPGRGDLNLPEERYLVGQASDRTRLVPTFPRPVIDAHMLTALEL